MTRAGAFYYYSTMLRKPSGAKMESADMMMQFGIVLPPRYDPSRLPQLRVTTQLRRFDHTCREEGVETPGSVKDDDTVFTHGVYELIG